MKKFLVAGVSALTTLSLCAGAVGILAINPKTQNIFDFTGKKQEIISELASDIVNKEQIIKEKDNALSEKDNIIKDKDSELLVKNEQITGLENIINNKNTIIDDKNTIINDKNNKISELERINSEKDNQIKGQEITINELNELLAEPEPFVFPEDISFLGGAFCLNVDSENVLLSSQDSKGSKGLWKLNKKTKEFKQLVDFGCEWYKAFRLSDGRYLVLNDTLNYEYLLLDSSLNVLNILTCKERISISNTEYVVRENETYFVFGISTSNVVNVFNKKTNLLLRNQDLRISNSCLYDKYFINSQSSTKIDLWDLENNIVRSIETTSQYLPIVYNNEIYLLSNTAMSKLDWETKEIQVLREDLSISALPNFYQTFDDEFEILAYGSYGSTAYNVCLIDMENYDVVVVGKFTFDKVERNKINNNILMFYSSSNIRSFNLTTKTLKTYINSNFTTHFVLNDKYVAVFTSTTISIVEIDGSSKYYANISGSPLYSSCDYLGDGKYKFVSDNVISIYDENENTFTAYSLIIE